MKICLCLVVFLPQSLPKCFQCSQISRPFNCPKAGDRLEEKTTTMQGDGIETCSIITADSGAIYHQGSLSPSLCTNAKYRKHMAMMVARQRKDFGATVTCCNRPGCNWNLTTSTKNLEYSQFTKKASRSSSLVVTAGSSLPWVVLILILIALSSLILVVYLRSRYLTKKRDQNEDRQNIVAARKQRSSGEERPGREDEARLRWEQKDVRSPERMGHVKEDAGMDTWRRLAGVPPRVDTNYRFERMMDQARRAQEVGGGERRGSILSVSTVSEGMAESRSGLVGTGAKSERMATALASRWDIVWSQTPVSKRSFLGSDRSTSTRCSPKLSHQRVRKRSASLSELRVKTQNEEVRMSVTPSHGIGGSQGRSISAWSDGKKSGAVSGWSLYGKQILSASILDGRQSMLNGKQSMLDGRLSKCSINTDITVIDVKEAKKSSRFSDIEI